MSVVSKLPRCSTEGPLPPMAQAAKSASMPTSLRAILETPFRETMASLVQLVRPPRIAMKSRTPVMFGVGRSTCDWEGALGRNEMDVFIRLARRVCVRSSLPRIFLTDR